MREEAKALGTFGLDSAKYVLYFKQNFDFSKTASMLNTGHTKSSLQTLELQFYQPRISV